MNRRHSASLSLLLVSSVALAGCADGSAGASDESAGSPSSSESVDPADREAQEAAGPTPRLAVTHDGGVAVLDGATLETLGDFEAEGFLRVNPAGDGRHVFLTEGDGFRLLDAGTWGEPHGSHAHHCTTDPVLTDVTVEGDHPGHVVPHHGTGALFFDGTGEIRSYELAELSTLAEDGYAGELSTEAAETAEAHHGVAVVLEDGSRLETLGDEERRSGAHVVDADGEEIARSEDCPGVHGEAALSDGTIALGCEDGVLLSDGGSFTKVDAEPDYARIGNLFPAEGSSVLLGDYNTDEDAEEPMTQVALVDAESEEVAVADVGAAYTFRSLARGPAGEALVLAEDGVLHTFDEETGEELEALEVMDPWTEPEEWQQPRPAIRVEDDVAYITEPDAEQIHLVDLAAGEVLTTVDVGFTPNEIVVVDGEVVERAADEEPDGHDEGSEGDSAQHDEGSHDH